MLLTNTDSLMCKIETENVYEDFYKDKEFLNFSNTQMIQNTMIIQII